MVSWGWWWGWCRGQGKGAAKTEGSMVIICPQRGKVGSMLQTWRQSSLPERQNPPGLDFDAPSENHMVRDVGDRQRRLKPITPTKPSTLSFRQSSLNGPPSSYAIFPNQPYQMPKVISKYPVCHLKLTITTLYHLPWKWSQVRKMIRVLKK